MLTLDSIVNINNPAGRQTGQQPYVVCYEDIVDGKIVLAPSDKATELQSIGYFPIDEC
jgi:hypothetical protein